MKLFRRPTIQFSSPAIGYRELRAARKVLRSGWLTTGAEAKHLEEEFAHAAGCTHAVATSSATAGLHISLQALGVTGDVVLSPYTFTASAAAVLAAGGRVHFADIEDSSFNIDCNELEQKLASLPNPQAIMPIHLTGELCNMPKIMALAGHYAVSVIEDAAHGQPGFGEGGAVQARGDCSVFSLYATKPICAAEGGVILTESAEVADRLRLLRNHGIDSMAWERHPNSPHTHSNYQPYWHYDVLELGHKYNLPDILATIARVQLKRASRLQQRRQKIALWYRECLKDVAWLEVPNNTPYHAWHLFVVTLRPKMLSIDRDMYMTKMAEAGIKCSLHYVPLHITTYWSRLLKCAPTDFPNALYRFQHSFSLPLHPGMTRSEASRVAGCLIGIGNRARL